MNYDAYYARVCQDHYYSGREDDPVDMVDQDYCAELIQEMIDAVYVTGNVDTIENSLDGLALEFSSHGLNVSRVDREARPKVKKSLMESFADLTKHYSKSLTNKEV